MIQVLALLFMLLVFILPGCGRSPLTPPGAISFYSGRNTNSLSASKPTLSERGIYAGASFVSATIFIDKIEVSKTGEKWREVLKGPFTVVVTSNTIPVRIGSTVNIPEGQYEGIRIYIQSRVEFTLSDGSIRTIENYPDKMVVGSKEVTGGRLLNFTTADRTLDAFIVEKGIGTSFLMEFTPYNASSFNYSSDFTNWTLMIDLWTTRFVS